MRCLNILPATKMSSWVGSVVPKGNPVGVTWQREQKLLAEKKRQEEEQKKLSEEQKAKDNSRAPLQENKEVTGDESLGVTAEFSSSTDPLLPWAVPPSAFICFPITQEFFKSWLSWADCAYFSDRGKGSRRDWTGFLAVGKTASVGAVNYRKDFRGRKCCKFYFRSNLGTATRWQHSHVEWWWFGSGESCGCVFMS